MAERSPLAAIQAQRADYGNSFGLSYIFPEGDILGVHVELNPLYYNFEVGISIRERGRARFGVPQLASGTKAEGTDIKIRPYTFVSQTQLIEASQWSGPPVGGSSEKREVIGLAGSNPYFTEYVDRQTERLVLVKGLESDFIVGIEKDKIFVDGRDQAGALRFTVELPRSGEESYRKIELAESRLLVFEDSQTQEEIGKRVRNSPE